MRGWAHKNQKLWGRVHGVGKLEDDVIDGQRWWKPMTSRTLCMNVAERKTWWCRGSMQKTCYLWQLLLIFSKNKRAKIIYFVLFTISLFIYDLLFRLTSMNQWQLNVSITADRIRQNPGMQGSLSSYFFLEAFNFCFVFFCLISLILWWFSHLVLSNWCQNISTHTHYWTTLVDRGCFCGLLVSTALWKIRVIVRRVDASGKTNPE